MAEVGVRREVGVLGSRSRRSKRGVSVVYRERSFYTPAYRGGRGERKLLLLLLFFCFLPILLLLLTCLLFLSFCCFYIFPEHYKLYICSFSKNLYQGPLIILKRPNPLTHNAFFFTKTLFWGDAHNLNCLFFHKQILFMGKLAIFIMGKPQDQFFLQM